MIKDRTRRKIEHVIETCNDCRHCVVADNRRETKSSFAICMLPEKPIIIQDSQTGDVLHHKLLIPAFCGLEDYTTKKDNDTNE